MVSAETMVHGDPLLVRECSRHQQLVVTNPGLARDSKGNVFFLGLAIGNLMEVANG